MRDHKSTCAGCRAAPGRVCYPDCPEKWPATPAAPAPVAPSTPSPLSDDEAAQIAREGTEARRAWDAYTAPMERITSADLEAVVRRSGTLESTRLDHGRMRALYGSGGSAPPAPVAPSPMTERLAEALVDYVRDVVADRSVEKCYGPDEQGRDEWTGDHICTACGHDPGEDGTDCPPECLRLRGVKLLAEYDAASDKPVAGEWDSHEDAPAVLCLDDTGACVANVYARMGGVWEWNVYNADCDRVIKHGTDCESSKAARDAAVEWVRAHAAELDWRLPDATRTVPPVTTEAREPAPTPACTGLTAKWCPVHGECKCPPSEVNEPTFDDPTCPLHSAASQHGEPAPTPSTQGVTWRREPPTDEEVKACDKWWQCDDGGEWILLGAKGYSYERRREIGGRWSPCLPPGSPGTAPTPPAEVRDAAQRLLAYMDGRAVSHCNAHPQCTDQDNPLRRENWCPWCVAVGDLRDALAAACGSKEPT